MKALAAELAATKAATFEEALDMLIAKYKRAAEAQAPACPYKRAHCGRDGRFCSACTDS